MNSQLIWDDYRLVLAVSDQGSLSGAGRQLGVSHATVFRRLGQVEQRLGASLFERSRSGYVATLAGEEIAAAARRMEAQALEAERKVAGRDLRPSGTVRVTTTDTLLSGLLSPVLVDFRDAYPDISLEIAVSNEVFSLSRREADVALRPAVAPPESLVGRRIAIIAQAVYGHERIVARLGSPPDFAKASWIGPDERMPYRSVDRWMAEQGVEELCRYRVDTLLGMADAVRAGAGLAVLSCYLADPDPGLVRLGDTIPELATDLWLLTHPDLRRTGRVRAFLDFVADAVSGHRRLLRGDA